MPRGTRFDPIGRDILSSDNLANIPSHSSIDVYFSDSEEGGGMDDSDDDTGFGEQQRRRVSARTHHRPRQHADHQETTPHQPARHIVIYHVECNRGGTHKKHERTTAYLDHPRMFRGDSKLSALRGKKALEDVAEYLEQHADVRFVVNKRFHCQNYHEEVAPLFDPPPSPRDPRLPESIQPYFFSLRRDGHPAVETSEGITVLSTILKGAIVAATGIESEYVSRLEDSKHMDMLVQLLYQYHRFREERGLSLSLAQRRVLDDLLDYVRAAYRHQYDEADELLSQGLITQPHLAKLCGPNEIMVTNVETHPRAYVIDHPPGSGSTPLLLQMWSWAFDDGTFRQKGIEMLLDWPSSAALDDAVKITNLDIYPLRYADSSVEKRLKARGEVFWSCRKQSVVAYDPPNGLLGIQMTNPRYMIDLKTYWAMHPEPDETPSEQELDSESMERTDPPMTPFLLLLPHEIKGFGFNDKKWRSLLVERILQINWNEEAFKRLVMDGHKKELIQALVTVHSTSAKSTDIIEGKGNALIILLHGGPGTGKTLTAESVAELTRKPLYRVTCGDIGTNPEEVEKYLESVLLIGTIWGCVVLLDEADVFLEERRETDLQRNALVSVFLRVLEYYHGILILTSNRIGTFDSAFKSRFQLAIHYPALDVDGRYKIWLNFINGLDKTLPNVNIDELKCKIDELAKVDMNGRQIRNTVQTALQLAQFRKEILDYRHFDRVIKVVNEFEKHIVGTRGFADLDFVHYAGIRSE